MRLEVSNMARGMVRDTNQWIIRRHGSIVAVGGTLRKPVELGTGDGDRRSSRQRLRNRNNRRSPRRIGVSYRGIDLDISASIGEQNLSRRKQEHAPLIRRLLRRIRRLGLLYPGVGAQVELVVVSWGLEDARAYRRKHVSVRKQGGRAICCIQLSANFREVWSCRPGLGVEVEQRVMGGAAGEERGSVRTKQGGPYFVRSWISQAHHGVSRLAPLTGCLDVALGLKGIGAVVCIRGDHRAIGQKQPAFLRIAVGFSSAGSRPRQIRSIQQSLLGA